MRLVKSSAEDVDGLTLPAVLHWEGRHWVVLTRLDGARVRLADPAAGRRTVSRAELAANWTGDAAVPTPTERLADAPKQRIDVGWLRPVVRPLRRTFGYAILLGLFASAVLMAIPILTGVVFDKVLSTRDYGLLHVVTLGMLGALLAGKGALVLQRLILARLAMRIDGEALEILTQRLLGLPLDYFQRRTSVDIERRLSGVRLIRQILIKDGVVAISAVTQIVAVVALMFVYSWVLALAFLAGLPIYALLMHFSTNHVRPAFALLEEAFSRYTFRQIDSTKGIETVKVMGAETGLGRTLRGEFEQLQDRVYRTDVTVMVYEALTGAATLGLYALLLWAGALQVLAGSISVGELVAYNTLVLLAVPSLQFLLAFWEELQHAGVLINRLQDVFDAEPEQGTHAQPLRLVGQLAGRVRLRRVGFAYPVTPDRPVVQDVTLDIEPGTTVALVGRSGSGKSTLARCIAGLLAPSDGTIEFDGIDMRDLELSDLRRRIGFVLQSSYLFSDTIAANIALGEQQPDPGAVRAAAEIANAADFIERLPLGYETQIGEAGIGLSGGQAQRIAIARAIYHRPPVLVLDEATSALDAEAERAVTENLGRLLQGRTAFVIAHRLSTIRSADLIAVLEQGRLVETGSHDELIARRGLYYHLYSQQLTT
jgi:ATP-binding cassette subfamily B protein